MPSFESGRSPARPAQEKSLFAAAAFAALVSAACERIPKPNDHQPQTLSHESLRERDPRGKTPSEVVGLTLPVSPEGASRPAAESAILSIEGYRGPGTSMDQLDLASRTRFGNKIWDTREEGNPNGGTYLNHTVIPFSAAEPRALNGHPVTLSYEFTRTDIYRRPINIPTTSRDGALIAQRTTLGVNPETVARGPGPSLRQEAAEGADYTQALTAVLARLARPPGAGEIEADFQRIRAAADAQHDPNHGAQCGIINSPEMGQAHFCAIRTQRQRQLVIDDVQETRTTDGRVRVSVLFHEPTAP